MINEICQFVTTLEEEVPYLFEEGGGLKEGIYVALDIRLEDGKFYLHNVDESGNILPEDIGIYTKKTEMNPFFERCRQIMQHSNPVSASKIFNPNKKIFNATCSPYVIGFSKKIVDKYLETIGQSGILKELTGQYLKKAEEFIEDGQSRVWFEGFKSYLSNNFWSLLEQIGYNELKSASSIIVMLKEPNMEDYKKPYQKYLGLNVFNKAEYNTICDGVIYGISNNLSSFNSKKQFRQHQSASFRYNFRINGEAAQQIFKFYQLSKNKQLPNPLPVFVDKNEADLNIDVITSFNDSEGGVNYSSIIRSLLEKKKADLQNFYLFFIHKGEIIDLDFVPLFRYTLKNRVNEDFVIKELFWQEPKGYYFKSATENVFDFQTDIINPIFNNQLIQKTKAGTLWLKYFDDPEIKPEYGLTDAIYNLIYKYRYLWYCFVYKSMQQEITMSMINDMCMSSIIDDLRQDEEMKKTFQIRKKISIWFGLQPLFDNHFKINNMVNKTQELQKKLRETAKNELLHIENDDEFAFAAGQLIWKLLIQSESANRTHALLEPFLQKTEPILFKQAIANTFNMYKHTFVLYPIKYGFDKLFSEVMGYIPQNTNMKEHLPMILAGYFSESIFNKEKEEKNNKE
jgi:CRISPR-associated protein Csh1